MTVKANARTRPPDEIVANDPAERNGKLKPIGGSNSDSWNNLIANQAVQALWTAHSNEETLKRQRTGTVMALIGTAPGSEIEGMFAAQMLAAHNAAMECYRRAMIGEQTFEGRRDNLIHANKLSRTFTMLVEGLNRHRGKGQQKVTVEHVHVHAGGQAVVGMVATPSGQPGGGEAGIFEGQPHAKQFAQQCGPSLIGTRAPAMPCQDATGEPLPVAGDAKRPLSNARRRIDGSAKG